MAAGGFVRELVLKVGQSLGRSDDECEPYAKLLMDNWFDTNKSLMGTSTGELTQIGIPLRFAKELLDAVALGPGKGTSKGKQALPEQDASVGRAEGCFICGGAHYARDCPEGGGKGKGKSKGKGCFICGGTDHFARECPANDGRGKGGAKGKDKNGKQEGAQREFQYSRKLPMNAGQVQEGFPLKGRIIGKAGQNMKHIRSETGAHIWLCGVGSGTVDGNGEESPEPMHLLIQGDDHDAVNKAAHIAKDLIKTVLDQHDDWVRLRDAPEDGEGKADGKGGKGTCFICGAIDHWSRECPQNDGKGKGKGKGCFICGGEHFARECPEAGEKGTGKGNGKGCFICGGEHFARECPEAGEKGKGKGKAEEGCFNCGGNHLQRDCPDENKHLRKLSLEVENFDPAFPLRMRILGKDGTNIKHIRQQTGALVWLNGAGSGRVEPETGEESKEPLHMLIKSKDREKFEEAYRITSDLVDTVLEEYYEWLEQDPATKGEGKGSNVPPNDGLCFICGGRHFARECPEGGGTKGFKGKGKGKDKRSADPYDESRPVKRWRTE